MYAQPGRRIARIWRMRLERRMWWESSVSFFLGGARVELMRSSADAIDNPNSFDRVPTYWLPTIRALGVNVSCFGAGAKQGADELCRCRSFSSEIRLICGQGR